MAYKQKNSPFKQVAAVALGKAVKKATRKKGGSSYDSFIDNTASYLKGEQGLIPDSITGGKPTRKAIGDGIRKVANSIDPKRKSPQPTPQPVKASKPSKASKTGLKDSKPQKEVKAPKERDSFGAVKGTQEYKDNRGRVPKKGYPNVEETPPVKSKRNMGKNAKKGRLKKVPTLATKPMGMKKIGTKLPKTNKRK
jgi:hypothetical protein